MTLTPELPLVCAALALALVAILRVLPWREHPTVLAATIGLGAIGALAPIIAYPFVPLADVAGRALWEWSAAGGPTIQASYRLDGIGAIGAGLVTAYAVASLIAATRGERSPVLAPLILASGLTTIALAVSDDLIAASVLLGVLAAFTSAAVFIVAPPPAAARVAAYLAVGLQGFVLAALLVSRFGGASFRFGDLRATAISPGIVLAASLGAALFAGLYPFVPWRYQRASTRSAERETLRGLVTMPAGIGATLVLLRLLGVTRTDLTTLGLPSIETGPRILLALIIIAIVLGVAVRWREVPTRAIVVGALLVAATVAYPELHWSHVVLASAILTIAYAAAVSLAHTAEWEVVRYDVALATLWIGLALGTPLSLGAALVVLVGDAAVAVAESVWSPPHRAYLVLQSGAAVTVTGLAVMAIGAFEAGDAASIALALLAVAGVLGLQLAHLARRAQIAIAPIGLEVTAATTSFLIAILLGILIAPAAYAGIVITIGRPFPPEVTGTSFAAPFLVAVAVLVVAAVRSFQPVVREAERMVEGLHLVVRLADPVPAGLAAFSALDWTATRLATALSLLERRAGVGLAIILIALLLVWSVR